MANTTFNGPVRSENGFEQITKTAATGAITTNLDIDTSGNITTTGYVSAYSNVSSITSATKSVESTDSGTVFTLNRAAGIVVTLPTDRSIQTTLVIYSLDLRMYSIQQLLKIIILSFLMPVMMTLLTWDQQHKDGWLAE